MFKAVAFLKKRRDLTREQFIDYYENKHQKLIRKLLHTIVDYRRSYPIHDHRLNFAGHFDDPSVFEPEASGRQWDFDVITEITFHSQEGLEQLIDQLRSSEAGSEIAADEEHFLERGSSRLVVVEEYRS